MFANLLDVDRCNFLPVLLFTNEIYSPAALAQNYDNKDIDILVIPSLGFLQMSFILFVPLFTGKFTTLLSIPKLLENNNLWFILLIKSDKQFWCAAVG